MRASQSTLIRLALGTTSEVKASTWTAQRHYHRPTCVTVYHYSTPMFEYDSATGKVTPISRGWGSATDKCGTRKILGGVGIDMGYNEMWSSHSVTGSK
jgi:hypothetical protein